MLSRCRPNPSTVMMDAGISRPRITATSTTTRSEKREATVWLTADWRDDVMFFWSIKLKRGQIPVFNSYRHVYLIREGVYPYPSIALPVSRAYNPQNLYQG